MYPVKLSVDNKAVNLKLYVHIYGIPLPVYCNYKFTEFILSFFLNLFTTKL